MSYIEMQEMCEMMLEKFHILSAVGIESGEGQKPVGVGGWVGWGAIGGNPTTPSKRPKR